MGGAHVDLVPFFAPASEVNLSSAGREKLVKKTDWYVVYKTFLRSELGRGEAKRVANYVPGIYQQSGKKGKGCLLLAVGRMCSKLTPWRQRTIPANQAKPRTYHPQDDDVSPSRTEPHTLRKTHLNKLCVRRT